MTASKMFEVKVKYQKVLETGIVKAVTETYLVGALTFTEAEQRICSEMMPYIGQQFEVTACKKSHISELFTQAEAERWYRCLVKIITFDEKSGNEKKEPLIMLVQANTFDQALQTLNREMKGTISDWECHTISETPILDVYL